MRLMLAMRRVLRLTVVGAPKVLGLVASEVLRLAWVAGAASWLAVVVEVAHLVRVRLQMIPVVRLQVLV